MEHETQYVEQYVIKTTAVLAGINPQNIANAIKLLEEARENGRVVFLAGNGGSAMISSHFACDLAKTSVNERTNKKFKAFCLNDNVAVLTAWANDTDYSHVFMGQLQNHASPGDLLVLISSSGNSPNVVKAAEWAKANGMKVIGMCGFKGGKLRELSDVSIYANSMEYGPVEDAHATVCHMITFFFKENR